MKIGNIKINRSKGSWIVTNMGEKWHANLGKGLLKQLWRCFTFNKRRKRR